WVGTSGAGLSRLTLQGLRLYGIEQGLPFETVQSLCEDEDRNLWAVAQNGVLARQTGDGWHLISTNRNWSGGAAACVAADGNGGVWIGTVNNGLYQFHDDKFISLRKSDGLASDKIWTLMIDSSNDVWVSLVGPNCVQRLRGGTFQRFDLPSGSHVV